MKILANLLDLTNATATLDNSPFNGYTFEFTPTGELETTFLWRNGYKLDIENNPLILPKQPLIVEASFLEEIELPNDEFEYHFQCAPFTGTALFFLEGKLITEQSFWEGSETKPVAEHHSNGFLHKLNMGETKTTWFSNGVIESQYFSPPDSRSYLILYDALGMIKLLNISLKSAISHPLIQSKKFGEDATLVGDGITSDLLLDISQRGAFQDTRKLCITDSNISVKELIKTPMQKLELLMLERCQNIKLSDVEMLSRLHPNLRIDTEYL